MELDYFWVIIEEAALAYAYESIVDADNHLDAVEAVKMDYIEGARKAYEILTKNHDTTSTKLISPLQGTKPCNN